MVGRVCGIIVTEREKKRSLVTMTASRIQAHNFFIYICAGRETKVRFSNVTLDLQQTAQLINISIVRCITLD